MATEILHIVKKVVLKAIVDSYARQKVIQVSHHASGPPARAQPPWPGDQWVDRPLLKESMLPDLFHPITATQTQPILRSRSRRRQDPLAYILVPHAQRRKSDRDCWKLIAVDRIFRKPYLFPRGVEPHEEIPQVL